MRTLLAAPTLAAAVLALSGCAVVEVFMPSQTESRFPDYAAFQSGAAEEFTSLGWVPSDATRLATKDSAHDPGRMLTFQSETGVTDEGCVPGLLEGEPAFETVWWPADEALTGVICDGTWRVFERSGSWYGWTP